MQSVLMPQQKVAKSGPDVILAVRNLSCKIGAGLILKNIQFELAQRQTLAVLGPNGAGKSSLLKCIAGLLHCSGPAEILGGNLRSNLELKKQVGYLAHETFLYQKLTARENLMFFAELYHRSIDVSATLNKYSLLDVADQMVETFSRGMKQRLALARTLLNDPKLLLLDEPFTGLDQEAMKLLLTTLQDFKSDGATIVFTTHELERAEQISDYSLILKNGRQVFFGPNAGLQGTLRELYSRSIS